MRKTVNVARSEDEAERQAKGEDVIATQQAMDRADAEDAAAERAENAADMFEGDAPEEFLAGDDVPAEEEAAAPAEETEAEAKPSTEEE